MKLARILPVLAGLAGCAGPGPKPPAAPPAATQAVAGDREVAMPRFKAGQQWAFRRIDLWRNEEVERIHQEFQREETGRWKVLWTIVDSEQPQRRGSVSNETFSTATHGFSDPGLTGQHEPLRFPLTPGKSWSFGYTAKVKTTMVRVSQRAVVAGWETVTVPAGSFRALRIDHRGTYTAVDAAASWNGRISETYWYSPQAQRVVRREYQDTKGDGSTWDHWREELLDVYL